MKFNQLQWLNIFQGLKVHNVYISLTRASDYWVGFKIDEMKTWILQQSFFKAIILSTGVQMMNVISAIENLCWNIKIKWIDQVELQLVWLNTQMPAKLSISDSYQ